ncbi:MAG: hypothetical protein L3K19_06695 [Thermoplasmata archaeon]|nr:hypothetical protein [Thermoplasmata archaeon]
MPGQPAPKTSPNQWTAIADPADRYSTGIPAFDRLIGGGFGRGTYNLIHTDETIEPADRRLFMTPMFLNFLYQSRGIMAVLPARESPHDFRAHLTRWVTRRRFDTRVRIVDYVGEDSEAPYVVPLRISNRVESTRRTDALRTKQIKQMVEAERAVQGARKRPFIEMVSIEILETVAGPETAARMLLHGTKRGRMVGNLVLGLLRPGLHCADGARSMADTELALHRDEIGLTVRGIRPAFSSHLVVADLAKGVPHVALVPAA